MKPKSFTGTVHFDPSERSSSIQLFIMTQDEFAKQVTTGADYKISFDLKCNAVAQGALFQLYWEGWVVTTVHATAVSPYKHYEFPSVGPSPDINFQIIAPVANRGCFTFKNMLAVRTK